MTILELLREIAWTGMLLCSIVVLIIIPLMYYNVDTWIIIISSAIPFIALNEIRLRKMGKYNLIDEYITLIYGDKCPKCNKRGKYDSKPSRYIRAYNTLCSQAVCDWGKYCTNCHKITWEQPDFKTYIENEPEWIVPYAALPEDYHRPLNRSNLNIDFSDPKWKNS